MHEAATILRPKTITISIDNTRSSSILKQRSSNERPPYEIVKLLFGSAMTIRFENGVFTLPKYCCRTPIAYNALIMNSKESGRKNVRLRLVLFEAFF